MKKYIIFIVIFFCSNFSFSQNLKTEKTPMYEGVLILTVDQQAKLKALNQTFIAKIKSISSEIDSPLVKIKVIQKLRTERDSATKQVIGEENYEEYLQRTRINPEKREKERNEQNNKIEQLKIKLNLSKKQVNEIDFILSNFQIEKQKIGLQGGLNIDEAKASIQLLKKGTRKKIDLLLTTKQQSDYQNNNLNF